MYVCMSLFKSSNANATVTFADNNKSSKDLIWEQTNVKEMQFKKAVFQSNDYSINMCFWDVIYHFQLTIFMKKAFLFENSRR